VGEPREVTDRKKKKEEEEEELKMKIENKTRKVYCRPAGSRNGLGASETSARHVRLCDSLLARPPHPGPGLQWH